MQLGLFTFCVALLQVGSAQDPMYCDPSLCTRSDGTVRPHIACPGNAPRQCPADAASISMSSSFRKYILDTHNSCRNQLAAGRLSNFPTARRMPTIIWNSEMSRIASVNAMRCVYGHDECRNTAKYRRSGQNIARGSGFKSSFDFIKWAVESWWDEYKDCTVNDLKKYGYSSKGIGHFTAMAQDRTNRVGCALSRFNTDERILVCNYAFTNMRDQPVYVSGPVASGCTRGRNTTFTNLCHVDEPIVAA